KANTNRKDHSMTGENFSRDMELQYAQWAQSLAAARRYGPDDKVGSLNLIDEAARTRARNANRAGISVSLARPIRTGPSQQGDTKSGCKMNASISHYELHDLSVATECIEFDCHGLADTHIDALNHLAFYGRTYSGAPGDRHEDDGPSVADFSA